MKRVLAPLVVVLLVVAVFVGQQVWAAMMRQPPWTTHIKLAVLPALPWSNIGNETIALSLPWGFHDRGVDASRTNDSRMHLPFGFGDYRTQHPLGGGTTLQPLQVDVIAVRDDVDSLRGWFFNSTGYVVFGGAAADHSETLPGDVVIDHYAKAGGNDTLVRAVVVVDVKRHLRLEVIDELEHFDEARLRALALDVFATVVVTPLAAMPTPS